jgi:superfamily II DNA helicase RecQ
MLAILPSALVPPRQRPHRLVPAKQSHLREVASTKMAIFQFPANFPASQGNPPMADLADATNLLRSVFGFTSFREGQAEIIEQILTGREVLAVMPTGSGKSLCYQLPALVRDGLTIVVSPLIALMRNQVAQLKSYGIAAAALNSANDFGANRDAIEQIERGELRLVYVPRPAPTSWRGCSAAPRRFSFMDSTAQTCTSP